MPSSTDIHARHGGVVLGSAMARALPRWFSSVAGDPMITFLDQGTGERTELSRATVANWSAKSANLLEVEQVDHVRLRTGGHWAGVPAAIAAWRLGLPVQAEGSDAPESRGLTIAYEDRAEAGDLAVGPGLGGRLSATAAARPFVDEVLAEPDDVLAAPPPPQAIAVLGIARRREHAPGGIGVAPDLSTAVAGLLPAPDRWLLLDPVDTAPGLVAVAAAVAAGVSLVITRGGAGTALSELVLVERVKAVAASPRHAAQRAQLGTDVITVDLPPW